MLISKAKQEEFDVDLKKLLLSPSMLNVSVRLKGTTPKGSDFKGSGAMLFASPGGYTVLVSAKHNLEVYMQAGPRPDINAAVESFKKNVKIYYENAMAFDTDPSQEADISDLLPVKADSAGDWDYDVMILKSEDQGLLKAATASPIYPFADKKKGPAYLTVVTNQKKYLSKGTKDNRYAFVQTGFGKVTDVVEGTTLPKDGVGNNREGGLQYRFTYPLVEEARTVYNGLVQKDKPIQYFQFDRAIQLAADANNATFEGDSGGPLFLSYYDKDSKGWVLYLIGVTTGGDMLVDRKPCPPKGVLVVNTISTSLEYCYVNGLFK